jgi:hypothetical protein
VLWKAERHCGKQKGVAESRKLLTKVGKLLRKNRKAVEESWKASEKNWITSKENWISGKENPHFPKRFSSFWKFWGLVLLPDLLPCARMDLLC